LTDIPLNKTSFIFVTGLILLLSIVPARAQENCGPGTLSLKLSPFSLLTPTFSTADIGVAYQFNDRYSFEARYGQKVDLVNYATARYKFAGFKSFIEIQRRMWRGFLFSLEIGVTSNHEADSMNYQIDISGPNIDDDFDFKVVRYSITPKVTYVLYSGPRFQLEGFAGIGWKRSERKVYNLDFDASVHFDPRRQEGFPEDFHYKEAQWVSVRVALGMNFCYLIKTL
jgi:hypothetical protein